MHIELSNQHAKVYQLSCIEFVQTWCPETSSITLESVHFIKTYNYFISLLRYYMITSLCYYVITTFNHYVNAILRNCIITSLTIASFSVSLVIAILTQLFMQLLLIKKCESFCHYSYAQ